MNKKVVVMTGATSGFGASWFHSLTKEIDAEFFILARNKDKFQSLLTGVPTNVKKDVHFVECELSSFVSVFNAIGSIKAQVTSVDILINNAGIFPSDLPCYNSDALEMAFVVNHLAPLLITLLLEEKLRNANLSKIVNTSSFQHFNAKLNLEDVNFKGSEYSAMLAYQNSKLCTVLSTRYLSTFLGKNISINCFDPGIVDTSMTQKAFPKVLRWTHPLLRTFFRNGAKGAETGIYLSTERNVEQNTGGYYKDKRLKQPSLTAQSKIIASQLHQMSTELIRPYLSR
ncbi:SDR family NAD(P)-dependent oxidoreductase [Aliiglaciecola sp. 3_MG-2023]|uniref:SDR family NAD(P)-dependent oxidoreductase n=1 Tax=Aliiglaciecola sp. 3_MG-2023 TaxID=3062644 RepID=UPI0026E2B26E|nr:SDR family NAD(P)-dependent oxidoreductase [Aliiglaciecola sp. 3_MG-2023]MDO6695275.1 SDR family NAD(P)-dependent oxidoreductase [Aliiglaciecola sp. 3_MG-2023]